LDPIKFNIEKIFILSDFVLEIHFEDGKIQKIDFSKIQHKNWKKKLENLDYFNLVSINECGYLKWPNGEDFKPEHLYFWEKFKKYYF
jgi:hypothetical protein